MSIKMQPVPTVKGVTEADYQMWRHHPVTIAFNTFLIDYSEALKREAWETLQANPEVPLKPEYLRVIAARALAAIEMSDLPFSAMVHFYQKPEEVEDAAEAFVQDIDC